MDALPVVEHLDVLKDFALGLIAGMEIAIPHQLVFQQNLGQIPS